MVKKQKLIISSPVSGNKFWTVCEKNKSFKKFNVYHKIILYSVIGAGFLLLFAVFFDIFMAVSQNFFTEKGTHVVILATGKDTACSAGLLEPCLFFKNNQNEIFLRFLKTSKNFENSSINLSTASDIFISFEMFCTYFPVFHDFVNTDDFRQVVFCLPAGKINFCLLLKECFLNDLCWADLPKTYKILICFFIDILGSINDGQLYFSTETRTVDIFFNLKIAQEAFMTVKELILSSSAICNSEQSELEIKECFYKFEFYLNYLQSYGISSIGLNEFMHRVCSVMYTRCFSIEWVLFYSDTIEIYILWNWLPWSIAFVATVYYCFRPNTLFHISVLTTLPTANFVFVPVYIYMLLYFNYCC